MEFLDDDYCFACGVLNPVGLKLKFSYDDEGLVATFSPHREHQGYKNVLHGGIQSTLLDEAMARLLLDKGLNIVTVKMEIKFRRPVQVLERLVIRAKMEGREGKFILASGKILSDDGAVMTIAKGTFFEIKK